MNKSLALVSDRRRIVVKITVVAPNTGIGGIPLSSLGGRYHYRMERVVVQIPLNGLRVAAAAGTDKGAYPLFRTVGFLQYIGLEVMYMRRRGRRGRRSCRGLGRGRTGGRRRILSRSGRLRTGRCRRAGCQLIDGP